MRLLLVEDDQKLAALLVPNLRDHGFLVTLNGSEDELDQSLQQSQKMDFVVLDRMLGASDSKAFLPKIKKQWPQSRILILSAISTPNERTDLLNMGADDYLGKPFSTQELIARLRALSRRHFGGGSDFLTLGNLVVDAVKRVISVSEVAETLPAKEFMLLRTLVLESKKVWSKQDLLDYVWGQATAVETNVVESTVTNLRKRLHEMGANVTIRNLRNVGYWIED